MTAVHKIWSLLVGKPLDPLDPRTRHAIAVTPILAWVGLGADGLSSSCYGPEEAFLALTGSTIRDEAATSADQMRQMARMWGNRR